MYVSSFVNSLIMKHAFILFCGMICYVCCPAQSTFTISGYVKDASSGEALIQAAVMVPEAQTGTYTNEYGFYSLSLPPGSYTLQLSYLGYAKQQHHITLSQSLNLDVELMPEGLQLEEVVIAAEAEDQNVSQVQMSTLKLNIMEVKRMPQLLGEVDIIRSIQLLPGVSTVGEGATGFNVRGGNVDQNLILLDESPVYNSSHLLGFFSVFNADAIKDAKLYKGGIPANYGGRLSSVLDVRQKEGNNKQFSASGGLGLISSRLLLEAPLVKEKGSFMLAGRRSYMDLFLKFSSDSAINSNTLFFYDLNAKLNYSLGQRDRLYLSGYFGNDVFGFQDAFRFQWGNQTGTLRWNHLFSDKLFSNFTLIYSDYAYKIGVPEGSDSGTDPFDWTSHIINYNLKADFGYFINPNHTLDFGFSSLLYRFKPGEVDFLGENPNFDDFQLEHEHALESGIYVNHEMNAGEKLQLQLGLRYSLFQNIGPGLVYQYGEGLPRSEGNITDTLQYASRQLIKQYGGLEPRAALNLRLGSQHALKASYNLTRQYIHLISNTTSATPIDVWKPSGTYIKPAIANQWALGYFRNFGDNAFEASLELYYKTFANLVDYKDGAQLLFNRTLETELLTGKGRAYGLEFLLRKQKGRLTGWLSYTLSRTERKVPGINQGKYYPANYDKTHELTLTANWQLNERWDFSANFAFASGRPITYPDARYTFDGIVVPNYSNRNGARTPAYHRLDMAANLNPKKKEGKRWEGSWNFGVYNVYARKNPYSIFFRQNEDNPQQTEAVRLSIFATAIPSVTYNFKF